MKELIWLDEETHWFPDTHEAFESPNGLLAAGGDLSPARLLTAYSQGIFPWYSENEPILWWTPNPRMVIAPNKIHISRSLKKHWRQHAWRLSLDKDFSQVIRKCSEPRNYSSDTWISPEIKQAYIELHLLGYAHSIEVWDENQELIGGLYGVALGKVFFGESMFSRATNASKTAIAALSCWLTHQKFSLLDCQVANPHLESLGGSNIERVDFETILQRDITRTSVEEYQQLWSQVRGKEVSFDGFIQP